MCQTFKNIQIGENNIFYLAWYFSFFWKKLFFNQKTTTMEFIAENSAEHTSRKDLRGLLKKKCPRQRNQRTHKLEVCLK